MDPPHALAPIAGTVVIPCGSKEDCLNLSRLAAGMPIVAADNAPPGMAADTVVLDNRKAAELATSHLLSLGHKVVATISGPPHRFVSQERFVGFKMAVERLDREGSLEGFAAAMDKLIKRAF